MQDQPMNIPDDILVVLAPILTSIGGGIAGWFFSRKREAVDVQGIELKNVESVARMWRENAETWEEQLKELREDYLDLMEKHDELLKELKGLERKVQNLTLENKKLHAEINRSKE